MQKTTLHVLLVDIDGTLTPPRKPIEKEMAFYLERLSIPFVVAAGSDLPLLENQFFLPLKQYGFKNNFEAFLSNGTAHYECQYNKNHQILLKDQFDIRKHLGDTYYFYLLKTLKQVDNIEDFSMPPSLQITGEKIVDRCGMINFTPIGRSSTKSNLGDSEINKRNNFVKFDQKYNYRNKLKRYLDQECEELIRKKNLLILLGGQTSFDIVIQGKDKTNPVNELLKRESIERITFLGDALYNGGNDSVIMDYIENWDKKSKCPLSAISVTGWEHTIDILKNNNWV